MAAEPTPGPAPRSAASRTGVVAGLGTAQTLAWGSSYYLPAVLATPMAAELQLAPATVFAAFSVALGVSALTAPWAGRLIDRHGGRPVLMGTNGLFALGLLALALAQGPWTLFAAWALLGLAMGAGLYEAAFAGLVRLYGQGARNAITGITLIAGFASTVGWPLSSLMAEWWGWRGACLGWAGLHLLLGLPLNASLPRVRRPGPARDEPTSTDAPLAAPAPVSAPAPAPAPASASASESAASSASAPSAALAQAPLAAAPAASSAAVAPGTEAVAVAPTRPAVAPTPAEAPSPAPPHTGRTTALLAFVFAATWFTSTAMATHLPRLLQLAGLGLAAAVAAGALVGPAQVGGRLLEFGLLRQVHPLLSARLAAMAHPLGAMLMLLLGSPLALVFVLLHGAGNGILTIAKGTLPLVLFGAQGYGERQGWLMLPARIAQGVAPFAFGLALDRWGVNALLLCVGLGLAAFGALLLLRTPPEPAPAPPQAAP